MNLASLVEGHPAEARAVHDRGLWYSWGELRRRAGAVARALAGLGAGPGDRVALAWPTSVDFVAGYVGALAAGCVAVPLNPKSPVAELERELAVVAPAVLLAGGDAVDAAREAAATTEGAAVTVVPGGAGGPAWEELMDGAEAGFAVVGRDDDDLAVLLFTSGTSGSAKAAMLTHGNLRANLEQMRALPGEIIRPDDVSLGAVPLFHIFGLNVALGLSLAAGSALVLEERFDPESSLEAIRQLGVTNLLGVPTMFGAWVALAEEDAATGSAGLPGVRRAVSGAAGLPREVAEGFEAAFGVPVWQGYGLTEASPAVATSLGTGRNRPGSVGRPLPGVTLRVVDDAGHDVLDGDPGEIWVKGPNVFAGYWRDPEASAEVLSPDGWLKTGDIGVVGEEGDLFVVDRRKDLIIVSGFNVYPGEVEKVVGSLPGVAEAVVVGRSDPVSGEAVDVVIEVQAGARVTEEQVRDHCGRHLARYKCPTTVRFVAEMPRGLAGKALRRALREK